MMKSRDLLVIDGNMVLHRSFHKFSSARTIDGKSSSILFGFPYILRGLVTKFKPKELIIFFDSGKLHKSRLKLIPGYKDRPHKIGFDYESFRAQKLRLIQLLVFMGIKVTIWPQGEGDDLAYLIYRREMKKNKYDKMILVSSDKDFYQLIDNDLHQWDPNKSIMFTPKNFEQRKGYKTSQLVDYLTLLGDSSDKIPGYPGMGEKRTLKFLSEYGSISNYLESGEQFAKLDNKVLGELYYVNKRVIDLKYFYRKYLIKMGIPFINKPSEKNIDEALKIFMEFEIGTFSNKESLKVFEI